MTASPIQNRRVRRSVFLLWTIGAPVRRSGFRAPYCFCGPSAQPSDVRSMRLRLRFRHSRRMLFETGRCYASARVCRVGDCSVFMFTCIGCDPRHAVVSCCGGVVGSNCSQLWTLTVPIFRCVSSRLFACSCAARGDVLRGRTEFGSRTYIRRVFEGHRCFKTLDVSGLFSWRRAVFRCCTRVGAASPFSSTRVRPIRAFGRV